MNELNHEQAAAARHGTGVSLVIAGAGTGKTSTLVTRLWNTVRDGGVPPGEILVLSFSRKAAEEIRRRLVERAGAAAGETMAGTFHSLCHHLLRVYGGPFLAARGHGCFPAILDGDARMALLRELLEEHFEDFLGLPVPVILELMDDKASAHRGLYVPPVLAPALAELSRRYGECKRARGLADFDDLMDWGAALLAGDRELCASLHERWTHLFVDEFQDTDADSMALLRLLMPPRGGNLFVVGDDWQSIYGFRGARPDYLVDIGLHFPGAVSHRLVVNYRSRREIVRLSSSLIARNRRRTRKRLVAARGQGGCVAFHDVRDDRHEAALVAQLAAVEAGQGGTVAVLYRNHWQGERLRRIGGLVQGVHYLTMHGAKGLEFDAVIITGIADGVFPDRDSGIDEERRLLYVALTRARDRLHCCIHRDVDGRSGFFGGELVASLPYRSRIVRTVTARSRGV